VQVKSFLISAQDKWFVGYGNGGSITPTFSSAPTTVTWTGMPALADLELERREFRDPELHDAQADGSPELRGRPGVAVSNARRRDEFSCRSARAQEERTTSYW
jgi:hypothetical protein